MSSVTDENAPPLVTDGNTKNFDGMALFVESNHLQLLRNLVDIRRIQINFSELLVLFWS